MVEAYERLYVDDGRVTESHTEVAQSYTETV
jgi:hypothetical protein